ncbi:hypothetical protein D3C87_1610740 [compost metagenome]
MAKHQDVAAHPMSSDDLAIAAHVGAAGHVAGDRVQVRQAAGRFSSSLDLQRVVNGQDVGWLAAVQQSHGGFEDQPMIVAVEVIRVQQVTEAVPDAVVLQQAAQDALLRFDGMRRHAQRFGAHAASLCACRRCAWMPWVVSAYVPLAASAYQSR